jgi:hypothetical protein
MSAWTPRLRPVARNTSFMRASYSGCPRAFDRGVGMRMTQCFSTISDHFHIRKKARPILSIASCLYRRSANLARYIFFLTLPIRSFFSEKLHFFHQRGQKARIRLKTSTWPFRANDGPSSSPSGRSPRGLRRSVPRWFWIRKTGDSAIDVTVQRPCLMAMTTASMTVRISNAFVLVPNQGYGHIAFLPMSSSGSMVYPKVNKNTTPQ